MEAAVKKGTLYGVSVGPGDPELMTLAAVRRVEACPVLTAPKTPSGQTLALSIVQGAVDTSKKEIVPLYFSMSRDSERRAAEHQAAADAICPYLEKGQDVAMLNLGDVSVYATFGAVQAIVSARGYKTAMVAGVPSFCAAAARLNLPLTSGSDTPLIIATGCCTEDVLPLAGAKVLMKSGRQLPKVLQALRERGLLGKSAMVCNCGLPDEAVYVDLEGFDSAQSAGYFATILVKG